MAVLLWDRCKAVGIGVAKSSPGCQRFHHPVSPSFPGSYVGLLSKSHRIHLWSVLLPAAMLFKRRSTGSKEQSRHPPLQSKSKEAALLKGEKAN